MSSQPPKKRTQDSESEQVSKKHQSTSVSSSVTSPTLSTEKLALITKDVKDKVQQSYQSQQTILDSAQTTKELKQQMQRIELNKQYIQERHESSLQFAIQDAKQSEAILQLFQNIKEKDISSQCDIILKGFKETSLLKLNLERNHRQKLFEHQKEYYEKVNDTLYTLSTRDQRQQIKVIYDKLLVTLQEKMDLYNQLCQKKESNYEQTNTNFQALAKQYLSKENSSENKLHLYGLIKEVMFTLTKNMTALYSDLEPQIRDKENLLEEIESELYAECFTDHQAVNLGQSFKDRGVNVDEFVMSRVKLILNKITTHVLDELVTVCKHRERTDPSQLEPNPCEATLSGQDISSAVLQQLSNKAESLIPQVIDQQAFFASHVPKPRKSVGFTLTHKDVDFFVHQHNFILFDFLSFESDNFSASFPTQKLSVFGSIKNI